MNININIILTNMDIHSDKSYKYYSSSSSLSLPEAPRSPSLRCLHEAVGDAKEAGLGRQGCPNSASMIRRNIL